jgi:hypothetical protein
MKWSRAGQPRSLDTIASPVRAVWKILGGRYRALDHALPRPPGAGGPSPNASAPPYSWRVTLIANCLTPDFAVQVSDRRLTNPNTGEPVEENATKAILLRRDFVFGYTGFAAFPVEGYFKKTDWWLLEQFLGKPTASAAITSIAQEAAKAVARIRVAPDRKLHTFVGSGFAQTGPGGERKAALLFVSNCLAPDLTTLPAAEQQFAPRLVWLPETEPFILHAAGQPFTSDERRRVERQIQRVLPLGAAPVARVIAAAVKDVARRNPLVGDSLLVGIIPREAGETAGAGMSMPLHPLGAPEPPAANDDPHVPRCYYVPGGESDNFIVYGPHWTDGNMMMAAPMISSTALPPPPPGPPDRWTPP